MMPFVPPPSDPPDLTVVLPFNNEAANVHELFRRLYPVLGSLNLSYEILALDDGSTDETYALLLHERSRDLRLKVVRLARRFGKEAVLTCGLHLASGRAVVTMDSDLQHPPETIPALVAAWRNGGKSVYALRQERLTDTWAHRAFAQAFYALFRRIAEVQIPQGAGDFRLLDRAVVEAINALPERTRFMKGLMTWVGFPQAFVPFTVAPRVGGTTHWGFMNLVRFAMDGLASFSTLPLRIWTWVGGAVSLFAFLYGLFLTLRTLLAGVDIPGYASLMVSVLLLSGLQLVGLGMLGEYLARVFTEVKGRPLYIVAESQGFDPALPPVPTGSSVGPVARPGAR